MPFSSGISEYPIFQTPPGAVPPPTIPPPISSPYHSPLKQPPSTSFTLHASPGPPPPAPFNPFHASPGPPPPASFGSYYPPPASNSFPPSFAPLMAEPSSAPPRKASPAPSVLSRQTPKIYDANAQTVGVTNTFVYSLPVELTDWLNRLLLLFRLLRSSRIGQIF
jgi:hypothetical protein